MRQRLDPGLKLDEGAELRETRHAAGVHLARDVGLRHLRPRIGLQLLQPERDLLLLVVHAQNLDRDLGAHADDGGRIRDRDQPISETWSRPDTPRAQIDERAVLAHRRDAPGQHASRHDGASERLRLLALLVLEKRAPGDDHVLAALLELEDAERVDPSFVLAGSALRAVSICEIGQKAALPGDAHLVPALDRPLHLSFDRKAGVERVLELAPRRGAARQSAGELEPAAVETTMASMRSPTLATGTSPSSSASSSMSMVASPFPPTSMNATSGPIATIVPRSSALPRTSSPGAKPRTCSRNRRLDRVTLSSCRCRTRSLYGARLGAMRSVGSDRSVPASRRDSPARLRPTKACGCRSRSPRWPTGSRALGFEGDAQSFADLTGQPMGAIVSLGGCSASFVSADGLIVTNNHCVQNALQYNSTPERNYLVDGFIARKLEDELSNGPGSRLTVVTQVLEVTDDLKRKLTPALTDRKRYDVVDALDEGAHRGVREGRIALPGGAVLRRLALVRDQAARDQGRAPRLRPRQGDRQLRRRDRQLALAPAYGRFLLLPRLRRPRRQACALREENVPYRPKRLAQGVAEGC